MCADQPATRAHVNIGVNRSAGISAMSRITADQNSTFVASTRSGRRALSSASAACSSASATSNARRAELARRAPQHAGPRVLGAVHAVPEAHEPLAAVQRVLDPPVGVAERLDLVEHLQHARGRTAVQGPERAPTPAPSAAATSAPVEATTRAVNVEAFMPCSAAEIQ